MVAYEKAEWCLETQHTGGPIQLDIWAAELWKDNRVKQRIKLPWRLEKLRPMQISTRTCQR